MPSILYYPPNPNSDPFWDDTILFMPFESDTQYADLKGNTTTPAFFVDHTNTDVYGSVAHNNSFNLGNSNFTIECFVNLTVDTGFQHFIFSFYDTTSPYQNPWLRFFFFTTGALLLDIITTAEGYASINSGSFTFATGIWYHVAVTRNGSSWTMWVNGTAYGSLTDNRTFPASSDLKINLLHGSNPAQANGVLRLLGNINNLRITKACRYTATFTPPSIPLPRS